jgi:hypothetical protein
MSTHPLDKVSTEDALKFALKFERAGSWLTTMDVATATQLVRVLDLNDPVQLELFELVRASAKARADLDAFIAKYQQHA